jgi:hypothetical protein
MQRVGKRKLFSGLIIGSSMRKSGQELLQKLLKINNLLFFYPTYLFVTKIFDTIISRK